MNISSLIVYTDNKNESVKGEISKLKECEVITDAEDRIVVVVSSESIEDEIRVFKMIEGISGVVSVRWFIAIKKTLRRIERGLKQTAR